MHYALISFLNARPLWWGLIRDSHANDTHEFTSPARCADLLAEGKAHLGLVPAVEMMRIPDLVAVPGICIASRSEVRSVLMFSRVPLESIRSVALDPSSRTSVVLARILLAERLGEETYREIRFDAVESQHLASLEGHDAAVIIGDPALQASRSHGSGSMPGIRRYDLASEWYAMWGEPFVFALWAGRRDVLAECDARRLVETLDASRGFGLNHVETIAREASEELGLPWDELIEYFRSALHYDLGEPERRGLARFYSLAKKWSLIEKAKDIEWLDTRETAGRENGSTPS